MERSMRAHRNDVRPHRRSPPRNASVGTAPTRGQLTDPGERASVRVVVKLALPRRVRRARSLVGSRIHDLMKLTVDPHLVGDPAAGSLKLMPAGHRSAVQIDGVEHGPSSLHPDVP